MTDKLLTEHEVFGVSKLKRRLHSLVYVYNCQNATLLEITCHGSYRQDRRNTNVLQGTLLHQQLITKSKTIIDSSQTKKNTIKVHAQNKLFDEEL